MDIANTYTIQIFTHLEDFCPNCFSSLIVMLSSELPDLSNKIPFQSEPSLGEALTTRHANMTSSDLFSFSEELLFLNGFTRSIIYAGAKSVDMNPLELDYTKINSTNWSKTFLRQNCFLGELKQPFKHIH